MPTSNRVSDGAKLTSFGLGPWITTRLEKLGIITLGDLSKMTYQQMIEMPGIGANTILEMIRILQSNDRKVEGLPDYDLNHSKVRTAREEVAAALNRPRAQRQSRRRQSQEIDTTRPYVEVIITRGYRCRSCDRITKVAENETPKGVEFSGFTWADDIGVGHQEPYFVCLECSTDVAIVGKITAALLNRG